MALCISIISLFIAALDLPPDIKAWLKLKGASLSLAPGILLCFLFFSLLLYFHVSVFIEMLLRRVLQAQVGDQPFKN